MSLSSRRREPCLRLAEFSCFSRAATFGTGDYRVVQLAMKFIF